MKTNIPLLLSVIFTLLTYSVRSGVHTYIEEFDLITGEGFYEETGYDEDYGYYEKISTFDDSGHFEEMGYSEESGFYEEHGCVVEDGLCEINGLSESCGSYHEEWVSNKLDLLDFNELADQVLLQVWDGKKSFVSNDVMLEMEEHQVDEGEGEKWTSSESSVVDLLDFHELDMMSLLFKETLDVPWIWMPQPFFNNQPLNKVRGLSDDKINIWFHRDEGEILFWVEIVDVDGKVVGYTAWQLALSGEYVHDVTINVTDVEGGAARTLFTKKVRRMFAWDFQIQSERGIEKDKWYRYTAMNNGLVPLEDTVGDLNNYTRKIPIYKRTNLIGGIVPEGCGPYKVEINYILSIVIGSLNWFGRRHEDL